MNLKDIVVETAKNGTGFIRANTVIIIACVVLAVIIALYLFRSIAIYKLGKNNGAKLYGFAFVPFAWIYVASKLIVDPTMFSKRVKRFALIMLIVFSVCTVLTLLHEILLYFPLVDYYFRGGVITYYEDITVAQGVQYFSDSGIRLETGFYLPYSDAFVRFISVLGNFTLLTDIIKTVMLITFYFNFFRTFYPERVVPYGILSVFGFFPFTAFAIRNKKAVNYAEYMKSKYQAFYGNQNAGNSFGSPFDNFGSENKGNNRTPFSGFDNGDNSGEKPNEKEEPFDDFFGKGDK